MKIAYVNDEKTVHELIKIVYGKIQTCRTAVNNRCHSLVKYGGQLGRDGGEVLQMAQEEIARYLAIHRFNDMNISNISILSFIQYHQHSYYNE